MKKFEVGKTYSSRCFNDHNLFETVEVIDGGECADNGAGFGYLRA